MKYCLDNISFNEIMTTKIFFYDDSSQEKCLKFCRDRNITNFPSLSDSDVCYKLVNDKFQRQQIDIKQKIDFDDNIFDEIVVEKFKAYEVLFVFRKDELVGVVHFSDYNKPPVFPYAYSLFLELEKSLRELLMLNNLRNEDMINFFEGHSSDKIYSDRFAWCETIQFKKGIKELSPFQGFYLTDLIALSNSRNILEIPVEIGELRNEIMHAKNFVKHKDYETANFIYDFKSFEILVKRVKLIQLQIRRVTNAINMQGDL